MDQPLRQSRGFAWQRGYGIGAVAGEELERAREYLRDQELHHRQSSLIPAYEEAGHGVMPGSEGTTGTGWA